MFKGLIAAISAFFLSFFSPHTNTTQNTAQHEKSSSQGIGDSYFYFDAPTHITVHLDMGQKQGSRVAPNQSQNYGMKRYFLQADVQVSGCMVQSNDAQDPIDITGKRYVEFGVSLLGECNAQTLSVSGEKIQQNSVVINGKSYTSTKKTPFGPYILRNAVQQERLFVMIFPLDHQNSMEVQSTKKIVFKLVNDRQEQIDPIKVEWVRIRSLDAQKILLDVNGTLKDLDERTNSSYGTFVLHSLSQPGMAKVRVEAKIAGDVIPLQVKSDYQVQIVPKPVMETKAQLFAPFSTITPFQNYQIQYKVFQDGQIADPQNIQKVEFFVAYGYILYDGEKKDRLEVEGKSAGKLYIQAKPNAQQCKIDMKVTLKNGKTSTDTMILAVSPTPANQIALTYIDTNASNGQFVSTYKVHVSGTVEDKRVKIEVVSPKILYPEAYYSGFSTGAIDNDNPYVYYEGIKYTGVWDALNGEEPQHYSGHLYNQTYTYFATDAYDLSQVKTGIDKLIILPNKYNTDKRILGSWDILFKRPNANAVRLKEKSPIEADNLSFVIGDASRYDPVHATISYVMLDRSNGIYTLDENNSATFTLTYNPFMIGKDIFISVKSSEEPRYANSFKRTLKATKLNYPDTYDCNRESCLWRVAIALEGVADARLIYSKIEKLCVGTDAGYSVRSAYDVARYGCDRAWDIISPRTDKNGYIFVCVYPKGEAEVDPETNETKMNYKGSVKCKFNIAEEFAY